MDSRGIKVAAPFHGQRVQLFQAVNRLELQARLQLALDNVTGLFHLSGSAGVVRLVRYQVNAQRAAHVFRHTGGVGRAGIEVEYFRYAVQHIRATALLHRIDKDRTEVFTGLRAHHVFNVNPAAGMVGNLITPHAVTGDAGDIGRFVLVELRTVHHLKSLVTIAQVVKRTKRCINLPDVVGVQAGHLGGWCCRVQLFRVQAIVTQGAADSVLGQREKLARRLVCSACGDKAV